jgi:hypothetical protein
VRLVRHALATLALIAGIGFLWISITYWALAADQLPPWLPGHKAHSNPEHGHHHKRHGLTAFVAGGVLLGIAWSLERRPGRRGRTSD